MRRALALAALIAASASALAAPAFAEHWTKFADGANGIEWSYDNDYVYKDKLTGRLVVMQAISKPSANLMPSGPPTGVGAVCATSMLTPTERSESSLNKGSKQRAAANSISATMRAVANTGGNVSRASALE